MAKHTCDYYDIETGDTGEGAERITRGVLHGWPADLDSSMVKAAIAASLAALTRGWWEADTEAGHVRLFRDWVLSLRGAMQAEKFEAELVRRLRHNQADRDMERAASADVSEPSHHHDSGHYPDNRDGQRPLQKTQTAAPGAKPWERIPDRGYDRRMLELWHNDFTWREISQRIATDGTPTPKTIGNRLSLLRGKYGVDIVPRKK